MERHKHQPVFMIMDYEIDKHSHGLRNYPLMTGDAHVALRYNKIRNLKSYIHYLIFIKKAHFLYCFSGSMKSPDRKT